MSVKVALSRQRGTASSDAPRRHHRALRQPRINTVAAAPVNATQIHSVLGGRSLARPLPVTYQRVPHARVAPIAAAVGSHRRCQ
ncbi:Uncharacterised protein [Mycobacterium tuberculosis]|uniref:Uncharacterized protein n=1 Tax=Mycobacterium tuberculosis TaxID=1773 RepID=A0A654ZTD3_MYCTX|nr:Uncharacterised protein [Mycobacterium tuberculosis]CKV59009.1 Uncharacterised protein [Mycobacterium tuberculosis]COW26265.1 Uncharacterised protein [Mycobacterium tuberculosis]